MSPRARHAGAQGDERPTVSIALPAEIHQHHHEAAPAILTKRNAAHVGMTGPELLRVLRDMRADRRFADRVIVRGKSFRAATPDDVIAYLRAAPIAASKGEDADDGLDHELLARVNYEPKAKGRAGR